MAEQHPTMAAPAGSSPAMATSTPVATESEKGLSAVAYIFTLLTGLIIFLVAQKEQRYARWNAIQAMGLGLALIVLSIVFNILLGILLFMGPGMFFLGAILWPVFSLLVIVLIVLCAVKAYQGNPMRLPMIADFADKKA